MPSFTVRVSGLRETVAAFRRIDGSLVKEVRDALKEAAEPVASSARQKISRYRGASLGTIRPRASGASVFVRQDARKVTGRRGDFGALQMRKGLEPALEENAEEVVSKVDDALGKLAGESGF